MTTPPDIIEIRIAQLRAEGLDALAISEEIGMENLRSAWRDNLDDEQGRRLLDFCAEVTALRCDQEEMEKALELTSAGWEAQKPERVPAGDTIWHQVRVMSWYWRRPARTKTRPGRLFLSTNQAWRAMRRESGLPIA